jgi:lipopolysaccharide biosynthesis regulator YciM
VELDPVWLLLLPVVFALGWATARYDRGQQRREGRHASDEVLAAMSSLIAQDRQGAIDRLLSAARTDPDAMQLHRAVGNLYRQQGLIDRAIEVHEAALRHPDVGLNDRLDLMADLGRDYQAAGLFDRAEAVLEELLAHAVGQPIADQARAMLLHIAQTQRDWEQAIYWATQVRAHGGSIDGHTIDQLLGHFYCELAVLAISRSDTSAALAALAQAEQFSAAGPLRRIALLRAQLVGGGQLAPQAAQPSACQHCGFRTQQSLWQCPGCHHWDSFELLH